MTKSAKFSINCIVLVLSLLITNYIGAQNTDISFAKSWEITNNQIANTGIDTLIIGTEGKLIQTPTQNIIPFTLEQASQLLISNSDIIGIAEKSIDIAKAEKQKLNSAWYPFITASGGYTHTSKDISVQTNAGELLKPIGDAAAKHLPSSEQLQALLKEAGPVFEQLFPHLSPQQIEGVIGGIGHVIEGIGSSLNNIITEMNSLNINFPLLDKNLATIDATATWPLFTGGKRIFANKIGKSMIASAEGMKTIATDAQLVVMVESYYTYKLAQEVVKEKIENHKTMQLLFNNAQSLMNSGMINKAELLVAQVALEEAIRELNNSIESVGVAESALKTVVGIQDDANNATIDPVSRFFIMDPIPPLSYFEKQIDSNNVQIKILKEQQNITKYEKKIAVSGYAPNIAVFAKQNIYSFQIPSNLAPRTVFGAGMVWNIFDGLNREKNIRIAKRTNDQVSLTIEKTRKELHLLANKLRSQMKDAINNYNALKTTIELCQELLEIREKSFNEGMATSFDVVQARNNLTKARIAQSFANWQYDVALANMSAICGDIGLASFFWFANNSINDNN